MKKYDGKKDWSETLYYINLGVDAFDNYANYLKYGFEGYEVGTKFDWDHFLGFRDKNEFIDKNDFITCTELFNHYQHHKI